MKQTRMDDRGKKNSVIGTILVTIAVFCLYFISCSSDDDDQMPSYYIDLVEANTNHDTLVTVIKLDNGKTYDVYQSIVAATPDTTYRCLCTYELDSNRITLYRLEHVYSSYPRKASEFKSCPTDPVKFVSSWRSGGYLNLQIGVMTTDAEQHPFAFCEDSITEKGTSKTVYFTLLHQRPNRDNESYTKTMFLSIPLSKYTDCDSFAIHVQTYEGLRQVVR